MREQRDIPYRFAILFMSLGLGLATAFKCSKMIFSIWLIYLTVSLIIYFINKHWKISAHAMSFAAGSAILVQSLQLNPFAAVIMITLVVWSRIQLRVHTPIQLIAGTMVGAVISVVLRWLMING
jgi:membrane-associated phospholipid phosphatase